MNYGRLPLDEQLDAFQNVLVRNQTLAEVLTRATVLALPGWYLVAGSDLPVPVQIRNQARVHLWYEQKFGAPCPPHDSTEAAIDTFEATNACLGVRLEPDERWRVYAPRGLSDVFNREAPRSCGPT